MKTNQTLTRPMGEFHVLQRTSDGYFNANELLTQWNNSVNNNHKQMIRFLSSNDTKEFIETISKRESQITDNQQDAFLHNGDYQVVKVVKGRSTINGKTPDQVWMHPYLFIDFAMWINPAFKYDVIKFVYDQLIDYRIEAGDTYRDMCAAIMKISRHDDLTKNIKSVASALNHIVYGRHERELRNNEAEENTMEELLKLQVKVTDLINEGFLKTYDQLINYLRKLWIKKYLPEGLAS